MSYPRLNIDCYKIHHNAQLLINQLAKKNISVTPVTKVCLGHPVIAKILIDAGAKMFADSRVENIKRMADSGISIPKMLIRTPMLSQAAHVVKYCDISLNSEIKVIEKLSQAASHLNLNHGIIIMVELGDLREGVMPERVINFMRKVVSLPNITIRGIGTNLACRYGIAPDDEKMKLLSELVDEAESDLGIKLDVISGGNSASINWALDNVERTRINNLRLGEAIFLGCVPAEQAPIKGLYTDAITLSAEVIEAKVKPTFPWGERGINAFGEKEYVKDRGAVAQAILALGRQDVCVTGLKSPDGIRVVSSCSDHLIVEAPNASLTVGEKVTFALEYSAFLASMSSASVDKVFNN
ncbi:alanine/ornithine racemase family PLP-dependent enzyme [Agarivorans sp. B2Z047]|uniref:alanine/ornithine racemase family PLP-dependent enzyme n=1 Tax=Agarivorans sp. B2Z047 TaxID=2652721 RepID=UPI001406FAAB|nr:alanine/ornithine racemase family PLP-dependent enzyme [Agarivorans sp. B2Z047]MPW29323.1 alanine/ornithine racemase family PLP-dependent enzyme [Agarivorans sp. B2Z047]UQN44910.1 alanine/ornithine racemase family PLP-dependent enzyme [Agarivorans sp. B2Z047]